MKRLLSLVLLCFSLTLCESTALAITYTYDTTSDENYQDDEFKANELSFLAINANLAYSSGDGVTPYSGVSGAGVTVAVVDAV